MKKFVIFLIGCLIAITGSAKVARSVDYADNGIIIRYDFSEMEITDLKGVYEFNLAGFSHVHSEGKPNVLYRNETFAIPVGYEVAKIEPEANICILNGDCSRSLPYDFSSISQAALETSSENSFSSGNATYATIQGTWPEAFVRINEPSSFRNIGIGSYTVYPVQYNADQQQISVCRELNIRISLKPSSTSIEEVSDEDFQYLGSMMTIPSAPLNLPYPAAIELPTKIECPGYLIVCPSEFSTQAKKLAEWKNVMGYNTKIISLTSSQCSNPDAILNLIKTEYNANPKIQYLVILGDGSKVQPFKGTEVVRNGSKLVTYYTDYPFGQMHSSRYQDLMVGRFPASTPSQLTTMIDKSIDYEKNPCIGIDAFQQNRFIVSEFDVDNINSSSIYKQDKGYFIWNNEYIRRYMNASSTDVKHMIYVPSNAQPTTYPTGEPFEPDMFGNPNVEWNTINSDIKYAFNKGASTVLLRGHGNVEQYSHAGFTSTDARGLYNGKKLPVVFDISCQNGMFYHPEELGSKVSVAKGLLQNSRGGAVAVISANQLSWQPMNCYLAAALYQFMYAYDGGPDFQLPKESPNAPDYPAMESPFECEQLNCLGAIFHMANHTVGNLWEDSNRSDKAYERMNQENFHCLGDPALLVQKKTPIKESLKISCSEGRYIYKDSRTLYGKNKSTGKVMRMPYVRNADITDLIDEYELSVPAVGYVPEIIDNDLLATLSKGGNIISINSIGGESEVLYETEDGEADIVVVDIYGNTVASKEGFNNHAVIPKTGGFSIVTLRKNGEVIDSKVIKN